MITLTSQYGKGSRSEDTWPPEKPYRTGRGHLLNRLYDHDWHLGRTAQALGTSYADVVRRIRSAGFESLLKQGVERMARD